MGRKFILDHLERPSEITRVLIKSKREAEERVPELERFE